MKTPLSLPKLVAHRGWRSRCPENTIIAYQQAAKVAISLRLDGSDLAAIKSEAQRLGIPYQTLIGSVIHQFATGELALQVQGV